MGVAGKPLAFKYSFSSVCPKACNLPVASKSILPPKAQSCKENEGNSSGAVHNVIGISLSELFISVGNTKKWSEKLIRGLLGVGVLI